MRHWPSHERLARGGKLILFGNGGSATDANDLGYRLHRAPARLSPHPGISLALEPANITAVANDIGTEAIFLRQLIAHAQPRRCCRGLFYQRRLAQYHHGIRRSA